jgi:hypothetical protein
MNEKEGDSSTRDHDDMKRSPQISTETKKHLENIKKLELQTRIIEPAANNLISDAENEPVQKPEDANFEKVGNPIYSSILQDCHAYCIA